MGLLIVVISTSSLVILILVIIVVHVLLTLLDALAHPAAVLLVVLAVHNGCCVVRWRVYIWVAEERLNRGQNTADVVNGAPRVLQNVQTDGAVRVDVRVEHFCQKLHFRRLVRIFFRELESEIEAASVPNGVLRAENDGLPVEQRIAARRRLNRLLRRILMHLFQILE